MSYPDLLPDQNTITYEEKLKPKAKFSGNIRFEIIQYATPFPEAPQLTYSQFLSGRLNMSNEGESLNGLLDMSAGTFFSRSQTQFVVHEFYASTKTMPSKFYFGRKKYTWSEMDSNWDIGGWQPWFAIDALRPEELGLTGLFADYQKSDFQLVGFLTPIFLPSQKPDVREEGGSLVSDSRWYRQPTSQLEFNSKINSLVYKIDIPDIAKLVGHPGYGVMLNKGVGSEGLFVRMAAGQKPMNDLLLKRKTFKDIVSPTVDVTVSPDVALHTLYSADLGYVLGHTKAVLSYYQDHPEIKLPEVDWAIQAPEEMQMYSLSLGLSVENWYGRDFDVLLSYLKVNGGRIHDITSTGENDEITLFPYRTKFTSASSVEFKGYLGHPYQRPLKGSIKYTHDFDQDGDLLNIELNYFPNKTWSILTGIDLLGVKDENVMKDAFLNQFKANDRVYGGMTYVY